MAKNAFSFFCFITFADAIFKYIYTAPYQYNDTHVNIHMDINSFVWVSVVNIKNKVN